MLRNTVLAVVVMGLLVGSAAAISGPSNGTWIYLTKRNFDGLNQNVSSSLYAIQFDSNWDMVGNLVSFSGTVPNLYGGNTSHLNQSSPGLMTPVPVVYQAPTTSSHAVLLAGAYEDNDPVGAAAGRRTMDVLKLTLGTDSSLSYTNVYDGKAYVASEFHTEEMNQVYYDKSGLLTGAAGSLAVSAPYVNGAGHDYEAWASITDHNNDGDWSDAGTTMDNVNRGNVVGIGVAYGAGLYSPAESNWNETGASGQGINLSYRNNDGSVSNIVYYHNANSATTKPNFEDPGGAIHWQDGPGLAVGDVDDDGNHDVFWFGRINVDCETTRRLAIFRGEDGNADRDALDAGEVSVVYTFEDIQGDSYAYNGFAAGLVESDNGDWTLIGFWFNHVNSGPYYMSAFGIADNGSIDGRKDMISTGKTTNMSWYSYDYWVIAPVAVEGEIIPEPGTMLLLGTGLIGALGYARRRRMK